MKVTLTVDVEKARYEVDAQKTIMAALIHWNSATKNLRSISIEHIENDKTYGAYKK